MAQAGTGDDNADGRVPDGPPPAPWGSSAQDAGQQDPAGPASQEPPGFPAPPPPPPFAPPGPGLPPPPQWGRPADDPAAALPPAPWAAPMPELPGEALPAAGDPEATSVDPRPAGDPAAVPPAALGDPATSPPPMGFPVPPPPVGTPPMPPPGAPGAVPPPPPFAAAPPAPPLGGPGAPPAAEPEAGRFRPRPPQQPDEPWRLPAPRRQGPRLPRKAVLIGAAGLAAAAVIAAGAVVLWPEGEQRPAAPAAAAHLASDAFATDPAVRSDGRDQQLTTADAAGDTVVAAGGDGDGTAVRPYFLVSTDGGRSFQRATVHDDGLGGVPRQVAGSASGWAALGEAPDGSALAWTSRDGRQWTAHALGEESFKDGDRVLSLTAHPSGFLAVGTTAAKGDLRDGSPLAWVSSDGRSWERLDAGDLKLTKGKETLSLLEATTHGSTVMVKGRWAKSEKGAPRNRVWLSGDGGRTWEESKPPSPKGTRGMRIGSGPSGLLAVRYVRRAKKSYATIFASADGKDWTETAEVELGKGMRLQAVAGSERGAFVVAGAGDRVQVVRSGDGRSWQATDPFTRPARLLPGTAAAGDRLVMAGWIRSGGDLNGVLLAQDATGRLARPELPAAPVDRTVAALTTAGNQAVAVGSTNGNAAIWSSADGRTWRRGRLTGAGFGGPGLQRLHGVAGGSTGWVAIGSDTRPQQQPRPLVAISQNGTEWSAVGGGTFADGKDGLRVYGVAAGRSGHVVVGEDGSSAVVWASSDLRTWQRGTGVKGALKGSKGTNRWMQAVAATADGYVAVGGSKKNGVHAPAVWTSPDGQEWTLRATPRLPEDSSGYLRHVAVSGATAVAVGERRDADGTRRAFAFLSTDGGATWQESPLPEITGADAVRGVTAAGAAFAVFGEIRQSGSADVAVWTSRDGRSWQAAHPRGTALSGAGDQRLTGLVAFRGELLGVGESTERQSAEPVLWHRPPL